MSNLGKLRFKERMDQYRSRRLEIWLQFVAGASVSQLGRKYGTTPQNISNILKKAEVENSTKPDAKETDNQNPEA